MQRTAKIRAALAMLELDTAEAPNAARPTPRPPRPRQSAPSRRRPFGQPAMATPADARRTCAGGAWPLAKPLPKPPMLPAARPRPARRPPRRDRRTSICWGADHGDPRRGGDAGGRDCTSSASSPSRTCWEYYPREHLDYSTLQKIGAAAVRRGQHGDGADLGGAERAHRQGAHPHGRAHQRRDRRRSAARWFNQPYLLKQLTRGSYIVVTGVKQRFGNSVEFGVRSHELPEQGDLVNTGRLVPVYALTEGLSPKVLRRFTKWAVDRCAPFLPEHLPAALRARAGLLALPEAVAQMHYPDNEEQLRAARRRLAFDELLLIQLGMLTRRANWQDGPPAPALPVPPALIFADAPDARRRAFPPLRVRRRRSAGGCGRSARRASRRRCRSASRGRSGGRSRRSWAICAKPKAMVRLLQGDVGSGKTVVAAAALLACAANG